MPRPVSTGFISYLHSQLQPKKLTHMIIQLDWFGCAPRPQWEAQIHQALEQFSSLKTMSSASVRIEEKTEHAPRYKLSMMLSIPGPDIRANSVGHTFEEAMLKLTASVRKAMATRELKARQRTGAARGVKAMHRG